MAQELRPVRSDPAPAQGSLRKSGPWKLPRIAILAVLAGGAIVGSTAFAQRTFGWSLEPRLASLVNWPDVGRAAQPAVMAAIDVEDVRLESTHQACLSESRGARIDSCFGSGNGITATRGEASQLVSAAYFDCLMSTHPHAFCAASQQNMSRMTGRIVKRPPD